MCVSNCGVGILDQNTTVNDRETIQPLNALRMQQGPRVAQMS